MCGEVIKGVDFGKAAGVDGAHEKIADICAGLGLIGQRNLPIIGKNNRSDASPVSQYLKGRWEDFRWKTRFFFVCHVLFRTGIITGK